MAFRELHARKTIATIHSVETRIRERFPDHSLRNLCVEVHSAGIAMLSVDQKPSPAHIGEYREFS